MNSLHDLEVTLQFAREREITLRRATLRARRDRGGRKVRRWLGNQLVRTGTWLASERPMRPAQAG